MIWNLNKPPQPTTPPIPNLKTEKGVRLYLLGLLRGLLIIGKPGAGKTRLLAWIIIEMMRECPELAILVLDASGALRKDLVGHILTKKEPLKSQLLARLNIDIPFHPEYVQPMPEFHKDYGVPFENQIQRVRGNFEKLHPELMALGVMGQPMINECLPELGRLVCAIENEHGDTYQVTEWLRLLQDKSQLARAVAVAGGRVPSAKRYFERMLSGSQDSYDQWERVTYAFRSALGVYQAKEMRARMGFYKPALSMGEMEEKGMCNIVSGERMPLPDHLLEMNYIFTQMYSMFRVQVNKRTPDSPNNTPFMIVFEEAPILWKVPGMADETFEISSYYRSRFVLPVIDIQGTYQTNIDNQYQRRKLWSIGNIILMGLDGVEDSREAMENISNYGPSVVLPQQPGQPTRVAPMPEHSQYTQSANWVQLLQHRSCVIRRYISPAEMSPYITYVPRIQDIPVANSNQIAECTEEIFKKRAVPIRTALDVVNSRELPPNTPTQGRKPS